MRTKLLTLLFVAALLTACEPGPKEIIYGETGCDYCRMTIMDENYGSELVTKKGKVYYFDSIECLAGFVIKAEVPMDQIHDLYFTDVEEVGPLFPLEDMIFVQAKRLNSPMGLNLSAYRKQATAANVAELYFGEILPWDKVIGFVYESWF